MFQLTTPRLVLRDIQESDYEAIHSYASDPDVTQYTSFGPNTRGDTLEFINRALGERTIEPRNEYTLGIVLRETSEFIGGCGLHIQNRNHRKAFLGYILHRNHWGNGYATEAARALLRFGFEELKLHKIFAKAYSQNTASIIVLRKIGMKCEGLLRDDHYVRGTWFDSYVYAMLEDEYLSLPE